MEFKLVSVVMPMYNASRFLAKAIESTLNQTYKDIELIIVDDCSTDDSLSIAQDYQKQDSRIHIISLSQNSGVANARNQGIKAAQGFYIALLDGDDVWLPTKIEKQVDLLEVNNADIAYCSYDFIDENDKTIKKPFIVPPKTNYQKMLTRSVISCSTALIKAQLLKNNMFNSDFYHEDYVLWMKLLSIPSIAIGDTTVLAHYRQVGGSRSNDKGNAAKERWKTYREALGMNFFNSSLAFCRYAINGIIKYYI